MGVWNGNVSRISSAIGGLSHCGFIFNLQIYFDINKEGAGHESCLLDGWCARSFALGFPVRA